MQDVDDPKGMALAHKLVHRVGEDIEKMSLNTIPSSFMEFINEFTKLDTYPKSALAMVVRALAPIAPHISEELWTILGYAPGIDKAEWPEVDPKYLEDASVTFVIQVNGKLRARLDIDKNTSQEDILSAARESVAKYLEDKEIKKEVFVPNRLVNFVL
ncbi:anticodon-binding domain of tRNA family protein [Chlamydia psittaci 84-8471/1]|nr:anticodon-binding domain of tRNA family protein [Chlamydia psittaci 84-8471/1]